MTPSRAPVSRAASVLWCGALAITAATLLLVILYVLSLTLYRPRVRLDLPSGSRHITTSMGTSPCLPPFLGSLFSSGFMASDSISNSLRVVKTYCQVNATRIRYMDAACAVIAADSIQGLFRRGLKTRVLTNGLQGVVLWKMLLYL